MNIDNLINIDKYNTIVKAILHIYGQVVFYNQIIKN